jgi:hypothetical protein
MVYGVAFVGVEVTVNGCFLSFNHTRFPRRGVASLLDPCLFIPLCSLNTKSNVHFQVSAGDQFWYYDNDFLGVNFHNVFVLRRFSLCLRLSLALLGKDIGFYNTIWSKDNDIYLLYKCLYTMTQSVWPYQIRYKLVFISKFISPV